MNNNVSGKGYNLRYFFFFLLSALNQIIYILEMVREYADAIPGWNSVFEVDYVNTILFHQVMGTQIFIMAVLFLFSFIFITYPMEKYLQEWHSLPITRFLIISSVLVGATCVVFSVFKVPQPIDLLAYQFYIFILFIIGAAGIGIGLFGFLLIYLIFALRAEGEIRKISLYICVGIIFVITAVLGGNLSRPWVLHTPLELIGPIFMLLGIVFLITGFIFKRK